MTDNRINANRRIGLAMGFIFVFFEAALSLAGKSPGVDIVRGGDSYHIPFIGLVSLVGFGIFFAKPGLEFYRKFKKAKGNE